MLLTIKSQNKALFVGCFQRAYLCNPIDKLLIKKRIKSVSMNFKKISVFLVFIITCLLCLTQTSQAQCNAKFTIPTISGKTGDEIKLNVSVDNFTDLSVFQWTIRWDPTVLEFKSVQDFDLPDLTAASFNTLKANQGYFTTAWFNQQGATKSNGSTIFSITFKIIGADGKTSGVDFSNTPLKAEFADKNSQTCNSISLVNGRINSGTVVNPPPTGVSLTMGNANATKDGDVCIPMKVTGFTKITALQFSLSFDTTKLKYVTIQNPMGLTQFDRSNFGNPGGRVTCVWTDQNTTGQTVADNVSLFEICFKYQGTCPSSASVDISDTPTKTLVLSNTGTLTFTKAAGTITCTGGAQVLAVSTTKITHPCPGSNDGAIQINATGGSGSYTYLWTNGATTKDVSNLAPGNYNVTVKDGNNTSITLSAQVTLTALSATTTKVDPTGGGNNGSINLTPTGGNSPYTFLWSNNATTEDINNLAAGKYDYTITDAAGCKLTGSVTIGTQGPLAVTVGTVTNAACGQPNGSIAVTVTGGTSPYTFAWTGPASYSSTNEDISALAAGTYKLTVKDAANATATTADIVITTTPTLSISGTKKNPTTLGNDGTITLTVGGGTTPYSYRWSDGATSKDRTALSLGNYSVTVTDARGCTDSEAFNLIVGPVAGCFVGSRVFTPNNDGINDNFQITCGDNGQLFMYNRWNQLVYNVDNFSNNWNGIGNNGLIVPDGAYYWILKVNGASGPEVYKGSTTVLRTLNQ